MKTYRVTFDLILDDNASHPRKWVPDAIWSNLGENEDVSDWTFEELVDMGAE